MSVLTEERWFDGSLEDLREARRACTLPLLRKDFVVDPYQVYEAAAAGADAIRLIVAALEAGPLADLHSLSEQLGLAALVEVHDAAELAVAVSSGAGIIGVNNRNLATLEVDLRTTEDLVSQIRKGITIVSESGIRTIADLKRMSALPVDALLVGEGLMRGEISIADLL